MAPDNSSPEPQPKAKTQADKIRQFRKMLLSGNTFMMPEVPDVASARVVGDAGFDALGTNARSIAWACGFEPATPMPIEELQRVAIRVSQNTDTMVNADLGWLAETDPGKLVEAVTEVTRAGAAGLMLADGQRSGTGELVNIDDMANAIDAMKSTARNAGARAIVTARTDAMHMGHGEKSAFETAVDRAEAYFDAGADCVLVPGAEHEQVVLRLAEVVDGPLAITLSLNTACNLKTFSDAGACCIMLGPTLMRFLQAHLQRKAEELLAFGCFSHLDKALPGTEIDRLLIGPASADDQAA